jgi:arginine repressor
LNKDENEKEMIFEILQKRKIETGFEIIAELEKN